VELAPASAPPWCRRCRFGKVIRIFINLEGMFLCVAVLYVNYKLYFLLQIPTNHSHICVVVCGGNDIGGQCPVWLAEALVNRVLRS